MRTLLFLGMLAVSSATFAQTTNGDIIGTLVDPKTGEGIYGAYVMTTRGEAIFRETTDPDGRFRMSAVPAGLYDVIFIYMGDTVKAPRVVDVSPDGFGDLGTVKFTSDNPSVTDLGDVVITDRLVLSRGVAPEIKLTAKDIKISPAKFDVKALVTGMTSEVRQTEDGSLVFRGARKGDLIYYIDGVKMTAVQNVPSASMGYVMVYSGAIPAKYGDTNGGVIVVETKGYFDLLREYNARTSLNGR